MEFVKTAQWKQHKVASIKLAIIGTERTIEEIKSREVTFDDGADHLNAQQLEAHEQFLLSLEKELDPLN